MFGSDSRNSVSIPARVWIADTMGDDGKTFLMSVTRNGDHLGWQAGKLSAVLDMLGDQAHSAYIGEDSDTVAVFVLTVCGPVPVRITSKTHVSISMTEHVVSWQDPEVKGKAGRRTESGFTRAYDA